ASRVKAALTRAGTNPTGKLNRDAFLTGISGLTYGDDPKQGIVDGHKFTHPGMKLFFQAPDGFYLVNGTRAVAISGNAGKGQFTAAAYNGDMDAYIRAAFGALTGQNEAKIDPGTITRTTVNGINAAYATARVNSSGSQVDVTVFAYELAAGQAVHFVTVVPAGSSNVFASMFNSLRRISATEAAAVKPRKLVVVTVKKGDTVQSLSKRMAYTDLPLDRFLVLNGLAANSVLKPGQRVKLVTY
uniref:LysM peptidoglycan-binding domain-containing protein n=1 Tax=Novosphingobium sp. TaxID=1874826 RepID=UPI0035B042C7